MFTKVISLLFLVHCVRCAPAEEFQTRPCAIDDFQCINESFETFMTKTASGIPALDVKPNDPLILDSVVSNGVEGVVVHFKNVSVTGLSKQKLTEYKMDTLAKSIAFTVTADINTASNVEVEYEETKKKFTGNHTSSGKAVLSVAYNYEVKPNDKGVNYLVSGPETITCDYTTFQVNINQELQDSIAKDPHASKLQQDNADKIDTLKKAHSCNILKAAYAVVIEGGRIIEKAYPMSDFFTNA